MMQSLLVPLDGSTYSEQSLPLATELARATGATVHLAHVHVLQAPESFLSNTQYRFEGLDLDVYEARYQEKERAYLVGVAERVEGAAHAPVDTTVLEGSITDTLESYADEVRADMILIATHGREGMRRLFGGSVADALIRHTTLPVLLVHPSESQPAAELVPAFRHMLVPLDGSETGATILPTVKDMAHGTGARVTLLNVVPNKVVAGSLLFPVSPEDVSKALENARAYLHQVADELEREGLHVDVRVEKHESPDRAIVEVANELDVDLVALATHGYGGIRRALLGSVADKVLRRTPLPILVRREG
jgi:nucleotide-binding universal stress UspA family protein